LQYSDDIDCNIVEGCKGRERQRQRPQDFSPEVDNAGLHRSERRELWFKTRFALLLLQDALLHAMTIRRPSFRP
jgi:hypothetical protein